MKTMKEPSWRPVLSGDGLIYCAPACGGKCTRAAFNKATDDAAALAKSLGKGWTVRVWENLGWHYSVISPCRRIKVHPYVDWQTKRVTFHTAFLGDTEFESGGRWAEQGRTARAAIANVVRVAKAELKTINAKLEGL